MTDQPNKTRRALLTGGATLAAGAIVATTATQAQAADGQAVMAGRANTASQATYLTSSTAARGFTVTTTNTGTSAHAIGGFAKGGAGILAESTDGHGALLRTKKAGAWGAWVVNQAVVAGTGGAIRADGGLGLAISAMTNGSNRVPAIRARSTAQEGVGVESVAGPDGIAIRATVTGNSAGGAAIYSVADFTFALATAGRNLLGGNTQVAGTLTKAAGSFRIDHPLDPANKYLSHSFVESPDMLNLYTGIATTDGKGRATVTMPKWFDALNRDFTYQLTPIGPAAPELRIATEIENNTFAIAGANKGQRISWQVTGIRKDAYANEHRIPVEHDKSADERGTYLHPEGFDQPKSAGLLAKIQAGLTNDRTER